MNRKRNRDLYQAWKETTAASFHAVNMGGDYDDDQSEWIREIQKWVSKHRRRPTDAEVLSIAKQLGYRSKRHG